MNNSQSNKINPINCLPKNSRRFLKLYSQIIEKGWLLSIPIFIFIFSSLWTVMESIGARGSVLIFVSLILTSTIFVLALQVFVLIRWNVLNWSVKKSLITILKYNPTIIIGVGRGGAHIAAMICHEISKNSSLGKIDEMIEPYFVSIDRTYFLEDRTLKTGTSDLNQLNFEKIKSKGNVLLVTAEVRTGATINAASELLKKNGVKHKTFTIITSPDPIYKVHYFNIMTKSRSLIPWPINPLKHQIE